jgi:hypothetical protein
VAVFRTGLLLNTRDIDVAVQSHDGISAEVQRPVAIRRRQDEQALPRLEEADMKQHLAIAAIALITSSLLCACTAVRTTTPSSSQATSPAAATGTGATRTMANVEGFYRSYVAALKHGDSAVDALVRSHVAAWYLPILEAPYRTGVDRVDCGLRGAVRDWSFKLAGVVARQTVIVIGSRPHGAAQKLWIVVAVGPGTGKISGITCSVGGANVTSTGARDAATSLYSYYIAARRKGAPPQGVIARLLGGGPTSGSSYLNQAAYAIVGQSLSYDPVTCAVTGVPSVSVGTVKIVAGGSVGLVVISADRIRALIAIVLGAKGWTAGDISCLRLLRLTLDPLLAKVVRRWLLPDAGGGASQVAVSDRQSPLWTGRSGTRWARQPTVLQEGGKVTRGTILICGEATMTGIRRSRCFAMVAGGSPEAQTVRRPVIWIGRGVWLDRPGA